MKAIILAAGAGKRMRPLTKNMPKCMLPYKNKPILERMVKQIKKQKIDEIIVVVGYKKEKIIDKIKDVTYVVNERYTKDTNSYSMYLALEGVDDDVVVYEADIIAEDEFIRYTLGIDFENKSVWFVQGKFKDTQNGGIIKTDGKRNVLDIKILDGYKEKYSDWYKTTGVLRISKQHVQVYRALLNKSLHINQYFHMVWKDNINILPSVVGESKYYDFFSFNTPKEYHKAIERNYDFKEEKRPILKVAIASLYPIEEHNGKRLSIVKHNIIKNNRWIVPIKIEQNFNLVLDGHHSLELAKRLTLEYVPVVCFDYKEINIWSLREERNIEKKEVIKKALSKNIFPYKTIKHKFPNVFCECKIEINKLKGEMKRNGK